jgi:hypothetical protein
MSGCTTISQTSRLDLGLQGKWYVTWKFSTKNSNVSGASSDTVARATDKFNIHLEGYTT